MRIVGASDCVGRGQRPKASATFITADEIER